MSLKSKKSAESTEAAETASIVANSLKECALALSSEKTAGGHWKSAAQGFGALYVAKDAMSSDKTLKAHFFGLVAEKMGYATALAEDLERGDKSAHALLIKSQKAAARATQATYWTRLLNYTFPAPAKAPATRTTGTADADVDDAIKTNSTPAKASGFTTLAASLSMLIESFAALEDAPKGVDLTGAIALLKQARAKLNGI